MRDWAERVTAGGARRVESGEWKSGTPGGTPPGVLHCTELPNRDQNS